MRTPYGQHMQVPCGLAIGLALFGFVALPLLMPLRAAHEALFWICFGLSAVVCVLLGYWCAYPLLRFYMHVWTSIEDHMRCRREERMERRKASRSRQREEPNRRTEEGE